jgi:hypothetical protein
MEGIVENLTQAEQSDKPAILFTGLIPAKVELLLLLSVLRSVKMRLADCIV